MAKYWDFRGSDVEEFQQMGTSDRKLQNNGSDAGTYFLYRNTEMDVLNKWNQMFNLYSFI